MIIGVVIAILFLLSAKYGNLATQIEEMRMKGDTGEAQMLGGYFTGIIYVVLLIPIMACGEVVSCFEADQKASFEKFLFAMPLSNLKIVGSRYLSAILFAGCGFAVSILCGLCISLVPGILEMANVFRISGFAAMFILCAISIYMNLMYCFGADKSQQILSALIFTPFSVFIIWQGYLLIRQGEEAGAKYIQKLGEIIKNIVLHHAGTTMLVMTICMAISFGLSVLYLKRRGGMR